MRSCAKLDEVAKKIGKSTSYNSAEVARDALREGIKRKAKSEITEDNIIRQKPRKGGSARKVTPSAEHGAQATDDADSNGSLDSDCSCPSQ